MSQTKKQSFTEALTNTAIGFIISYASTFIIFPLMGFNSSATDNIIITLFFTIVSILRSYLIRRYFNRKPTLRLNIVKVLKQAAKSCPRETKW